MRSIDTWAKTGTQFLGHNLRVCPNCGEENSYKARFCQDCGTRLISEPAPPQEARKTVTVLFCDLVGSTALGERLDSESLREVMDRYFTEMRRIVERHGGIVEKYIGDAVMAVFGLPRAHEDDALRAVRAASEMGHNLDTLNSELDLYWGVTLANRTGVSTGEVVVGDPSSGQRLATGDTVNVAARLEQAASSGTVLIGHSTYRLVRDAVDAESVEALALKGKTERLSAFRLIDVKRGAEGVARRLDAPMVGREAEIAAIIEAFQQVVRDNSCHLVAVLGEAGVGKSRLAVEIADRLKDHATVLRGRCLSYGEGITFWPLAEIIRQATGITDKDSPDDARHRLGDLLLETGEGITERLASVVGLSSTSFPIEETFWAARKLLVSLADSRPLVAVFEDIHWAEPTLMDWIEYVVDLADAPVLMVCVARPELLEKRASWSKSSVKGSIVDLRPLSERESELLIDNLLEGSGSSEVGARITAAAQGNPLFVEQIISMWIDDGTLHRDDGRWVIKTKASISIPPTISALLTARLDRLPHEERAIIACAAIMGQVFNRGAVEELCPTLVRSKVPLSLSSLVTKQFVRPDPSAFPDDEAFAFSHVLIREAAYEAMLKRTRAELHERFAIWLGQVAADRIGEYEEIVGYHLEQAYRYLVQLGPVHERAQELAARAAERISSAGRRALERRDANAAVSLLSRAASILSSDNLGRPYILHDLALALIDSGDTAGGDAVLTEGAQASTHSGDRRVATRVDIERFLLRVINEPEITPGDITREAQRMISACSEIGDEYGLAKSWHVLAWGSFLHARAVDTEAALERALEYAQRAQNQAEISEIIHHLAIQARLGPMPVVEAIRRCESLREQAGDHQLVEASVLCAKSVLEAMRGQFDIGRELNRRSQSVFADLGIREDLGDALTANAEIEALAGNWNEAERKLRGSIEIFQGIGNRMVLAEAAVGLTRALYAQGRYEEAEEQLEAFKQTPVHLADRVSLSSITGKLLARRASLSKGERLLREAISLAHRSDWLNMRALAYTDLAEILIIVDRAEEAESFLGKALHLYEQKGNIPSTIRVRKLLEKLSTAFTQNN
jgi:class 3 adenylate cyclase/tetratricopeptide (TPR) repeat protein